MRVSVIIPTYNRAKTIERAVDSVLAQTWKLIEVIVVDDGSTDNTVDILQTYGGKIRVIRRENGGPSAARNTGIKSATGEIISFLDSDDTWLPSKTERQVKLLQQTESAGVVCCVCNTKMFYTSGMLTSFQIARLELEGNEGIWTKPSEFLVKSFLLFNQVAAVRREALLQSGLFREDLPFGLNDDYDLSVRLSLIGPWACINEPLVEWYEHVDNISRTFSQLEICTVTRQILKDIQESPRFHGLLPQSVLNRRLRSLSNNIRALRLKTHKNTLMRLMGEGLHLYSRGCSKLQSCMSAPIKIQKIA